MKRLKKQNKTRQSSPNNSKVDSQHSRQGIADIKQEDEKINKQIQEFSEARQLFANEINKLPTFFKFVKLYRKSLTIVFEKQEKAFEIKHAFFYWAIFLDPGLKKTRRNIRFALKDHLKSSQVTYMPFEGSFTTQIYRNPIIQSFFEFSLYYAFTKRITLSAEKAKRIFSKACKVSLDLSLKSGEETRSFNDFLDFLYQMRPTLDSTNLPAYDAGRPSEPTSETESILELAKQGMSNRDISIKINPEFRGANRSKDVARIGKLTRDYGLHTRNRIKRHKA